MDNLFVMTMLNLGGIGKKTVTHVLENFKNEIRQSTELIDLLEEAKKDKPRIPLPTRDEIMKAESNALFTIEKSSDNNIKIFNRSDMLFPDRLRDLDDVPLIFSKGNTNALQHKDTIAIIGTREPTSYGAKAGERLAEIFVENDFAIVSGLAKGCDTAAHRGALNKQGITIAILAHGLDMIYPKENSSLAENIISKGGCLISEYPVGMKSHPNYFIERDRLQSGMSQAVIVVETGIHGGTMHTVQFAIRQKREIACLASHLVKMHYEQRIQGNLKLIQEGIAYSLNDKQSIEYFIDKLKNNNQRSNLETDSHQTDDHPKSKAPKNNNSQHIQGEMFS